MKKNTRFAVLSILVFLILAVAFLADKIVPYDPLSASLSDAFQAPGKGHYFGTDALGRDVFSRVICGATTSVYSVLILVAVILVVGTFLGIIAGYFGGVADAVIMRVGDMMIAFPDLILAMAIAGILAMHPKVLVLDEPTAGMDALARRQMWNLLKKLNQQKLTILLTTHYMEEAETLCDRVGFMCGGRLEETDAPGHMIEMLGRYAVDETSPDGLKSHYFHGKEEAIQYLSASEQETALRSTTLEDVFLETIGQQLECR